MQLHNITEDIDLSIRIQNAGMKIVYAANAVVYTEGATELDALIKQRLRWKSGRFKTFQDYRSLFFSLRKRHNKILTCFILPLAIFGDIQLSLELFFLAFLYIYSFLMQDFSSFISGIIVVSSMFFFQIFDDSRPRTLWFVLLFPIGWLLFYVSTWVECVALAKSLWGFYTRREVRWQRWQRTGVSGAPGLAPHLAATKGPLIAMSK